MAATHLLVSEIHGLGGRDRELEQLLGELASGARGEAGCLMFRVLRDADPGEFVVVSHWRDEAAQRAHYAGDAYLRYRAAVGEMLARPSDVTIHVVAESVRAADPNPPDPGMFG
jgi:quinol monooxygenase YgiN